MYLHYLNTFITNNAIYVHTNFTVQAHVYSRAMTLASLSVTCSESATISNRTVCMLFFVTYNGWNIILKCIIIHGEKTSLACLQIYYFNYINVTIASNNLQENNKISYFRNI